MHIGLAGLGKMGAAIAARLLDLGHQVTVWNRTSEKMKPLIAAGAKAARAPAELASAAEVIITILSDAAALDDVYGGPQGLLAGDIKDKLFVEMSTTRPDSKQQLAKKICGRDADFVECSVGGSTGAARQGKLLGLVGAQAADFARAKPLLDQLCRRVEHCGPVGAGALMKLAINLPLMIYWQALGEALALCREVNMDPARLVDLFADSSGGPNTLKVRGPAIAARLKGGEAGPVTFDVDSGIKDMRAMLAEGKARGVALPLLERALACYEQARRDGASGEISSVSLYWARR